MSDLQSSNIPPPLAWNEEGQPFIPEKNAEFWRVRLYSGKPGRPPAVWTNKGILHLPLHASIDDLRLGVNNQPGSYRLYPVDAQGRELSPVAHIELIPEDQASRTSSKARQMLTGPSNGMQESAVLDDAPGTLTPDIANRFFDLYERMQTSRDAHDALLANVLTTLVTTTAQIQQSTAKLLGVANTTIKVANGVEAIERQEPAQLPAPLDVEELSAKLSETLTPPSQPTQDKPWYVQLLNGPVGMGAVQLVSGFMNGITAAQAAAARQSPPTQPAQPPQTAHTVTPRTPEPQEDEGDDEPIAPPTSFARPHRRNTLPRSMYRRPWARSVTRVTATQASNTAAHQAAESQEPTTPPEEPQRTTESQQLDQAEANSSQAAQLMAADDNRAEPTGDSYEDAAATTATTPATAQPNGPGNRELAAHERIHEAEPTAHEPNHIHDAQPAPAPERSPAPPEVMSADEVARFLGVDRKTVYDYANRGELPHQKLGKRMLFSRQAIVAWLGQCNARRANR